MAAYGPDGTSPCPEVFTAEQTLDSYDLLGFLGALPRAEVPRVVVLDNAGLRTSHVVRRARQRRAIAGVYVIFLPPYSPVLNEIEQVFPS